MAPTGVQSKGLAPPSMVSELMSSLHEERGGDDAVRDNSEEVIIRNAAGNAYGAGADTVCMTSSSVQPS